MQKIEEQDEAGLLRATYVQSVNEKSGSRLDVIVRSMSVYGLVMH